MTKSKDLKSLFVKGQTSRDRITGT